MSFVFVNEILNAYGEWSCIWFMTFAKQRMELIVRNFIS